MDVTLREKAEFLFTKYLKPELSLSKADSRNLFQEASILDCRSDARNDLLLRERLCVGHA